jgi:hypothetical protein
MAKKKKPTGQANAGYFADAADIWHDINGTAHVVDFSDASDVDVDDDNDNDVQEVPEEERDVREQPVGGVEQSRSVEEEGAERMSAAKEDERAATAVKSFKTSRPGNAGKAVKGKDKERKPRTSSSDILGKFDALLEAQTMQPRGDGGLKILVIQQASEIRELRGQVERLRDQLSQALRDADNLRAEQREERRMQEMMARVRASFGLPSTGESTSFAAPSFPGVLGGLETEFERFAAKERARIRSDRARQDDCRVDRPWSRASVGLSVPSEYRGCVGQVRRSQFDDDDDDGVEFVEGSSKDGEEQ